MKPSSISWGALTAVPKHAAEAGEKPATRTPSLLAASKHIAMVTSPTSHLTVALPGASASLMSRSRQPGTHRETPSTNLPRSLRSSPSARPSGTDTSRIPSSFLPPAACRASIISAWMSSVLTKVTWNPRSTRRCDSSMSGVTCPCTGNGRTMT
jgi:hypothetical protein